MPDFVDADRDGDGDGDGVASIGKHQRAVAVGVVVVVVAAAAFNQINWIELEFTTLFGFEEREIYFFLLNRKRLFYADTQFQCLSISHVETLFLFLWFSLFLFYV